MQYANSEIPSPISKTLGHDLRWQLVQALIRSDRRVQELVEQVGRPQNLVSYHLRQLRESGLVHERQSSADGRDSYYSIDLERLTSGFLHSSRMLHLPLIDATLNGSPEVDINKKTVRVLFLCTHNAARSQLAEGILKHYGGSLVEVESAGDVISQVHPLAIEAAAELSIDISNQRSKDLSQFTDQAFDVVITVCDQLRERCPVFPNGPTQIHWSLPDPVSADRSQDKLEPFSQTAKTLETRIRFFVSTLINEPLHQF